MTIGIYSHQTDLAMKEDFLHYLWRLQRYELSDLKTTEGETIEIQQIGEHNTNAGPDFLNAKIKIGDTVWAGNVEVHVNASDWNKHNHQEDKAYQNVILHVVFEEDEPIMLANGMRIPALELKERAPMGIYGVYKRLINNENWIPCQHQFYRVRSVTKEMWLERMMVERLERKTKEMLASLESDNFNWENTFYHFLARNFGLAINTEPFEMLARSLPLTVIQKHRDQLFQIEALFFGQAGMLDKDFEEEYPNELKKEYAFLQKKYDLQPIPEESWKFLRLRPANFPTVRIAQFAKLMKESVHLFSKVLETEEIKKISKLFEVSVEGYWKTHYVFEKPTATRNKSFGKTSIQLLIMNTVAPYLFLYGKHNQDETQQKKAFQLLETLPAESNSIINNWQVLGMEPENAYQSQSLIQLKNEYCKKKNCLNCAIGNAILKPS